MACLTVVQKWIFSGSRISEVRGVRRTSIRYLNVSRMAQSAEAEFLAACDRGNKAAARDLYEGQPPYRHVKPIFVLKD